MQVTNSATIVDFFPEAFIAEADDIKGMKVVVKRFNKRVYFRANGMKSYSTVVATDAKNEWAERIANGAEVTDFNLDKMPQSEYMPMACVGWIVSLIKSYLHTKMTETMDNIIDRDQLQEDMINRIIDGMDIDGLCQLAYDYLNENYDKYSVDELITEVEEFYPDLIEESKV